MRSLGNRSIVLRAALAGGTVTALSLLKHFWFMPLYTAGAWQTVIAMLNGGISLLLVPGRFISYAVAPPVAHHDTPVTTVVMMASSFGFYFVLVGFCLLVRRWTASRVQPRAGGEEVADTPTPLPGAISRRSFLKVSSGNTIAAAVAVGGGTATGYAWLFEPRFLPVTRLRFPVRGLPLELSGFRIVQLTDFHHGAWVPLNFIKKTIAITNDLKPDLIVLTGDYVTGSSAFFAPVIEQLAELRATSGVLAVLGNHDWWEGVDVCREEFTKAGIPLIDNDVRFVGLDRSITTHPAPNGLCIGGVGDLWEHQVDFQAALRGAPTEMPRILLSHNPDAAELAALADERTRVDLMLSGHTHGGQIRLPFLGTPVVPSKYGQKYARGLVQGPYCPVYIGRGIGLSVLPLRLGIPPEILEVELVPQADGDASPVIT